MNNNKVFKLIKILSYVLLGLGVATLVYFLVAAATITTPDFGYPTVEGGVSKGTVMGVDAMLIYAYILLALTLLLTLYFSIANIVRNPKGSMRTLVGACALILVLGVSYILGSTTPITNSGGGYFESPFVLKFSDMGLYAAYVALAVAFIAIIYGEIRSALIKR